MQKVTFKNGKGIEIDFTSGDFGIVDITGISEVPLNIQTQQVPFQDGSVFIDALLEDRTVAITLALNDGKDLEKRYRLKRQVIKTLNPKLGEGVLIYENDYIKKQIKAVPQLPTFPNKNSDEGGTLKASLTFDCPSPYWEDIEDNIQEYDFGRVITVNNEGDVPTELEISIHTGDVTNPVVKNLTTDKKIKLNGHFSNSVEINTNLGRKTVKSFYEPHVVFSWSGDTTGIARSTLNGVFVSCGAGGKLLYSYNGDNWLINNSIPTTKDFKDVIFCEDLGLFILITKTNANIYVSSDGINWNKVYENSSLSEPALNLVYSTKTKKLICMFNKGGFWGNVYVVSSTDGMNWELNTILGSAMGTIYNIMYSDKYEMYIGVGGLYQGWREGEEYLRAFNVVTSTDGITWNDIVVDNWCLRAITYSDSLNKFIAIGTAPSETEPTATESGVKTIIATSTNGVSWTKTETDLELEFWSIASSKKENLIVATGTNGKIAVSQDGENWKLADNAISTTSTIKPVYYDEQSFGFIACGDSSNVFRSSDGENWNVNSAPLTTSLNRIIYCERLGVFISVGQYSVISQNGANWQFIEPLYSKYISDVTYSNRLGIFIAVATNTTIPKIYKSVNGYTWEEIQCDVVFKRIVYSEKLGIFVAVGDNGIISTSQDGQVWVSRNSGVTENITSICYSSTLNLFVCGINASAVIKSSNGIYWERVQTSCPVNNLIYNENFSSFIGVYNRTDKCVILVSQDGTNWTEIDVMERTSETKKIRSVFYSEYNNSLLICGNNGLVLESKNLISWLQKYSFNGGYFQHGVCVRNKTYLVGSLCVIIGDEADLGDITEQQKEIIEKKTNIIETLSTDSNMDLNLEIGENKIVFGYDSGTAFATIRFKNKYLGV